MAKDVRAQGPGKLRGLVLAGGRGSRMGEDKGSLRYKGEPQVRIAHALLEAVCDDAFVSVGQRQQALAAYGGLPLVADAPGVHGPAAGLLSAWRLDRTAALLVLAVDLPLVTRSDLEALIAARDASCIATAYRHADGTLEPLCAIWEPAALAVLDDEVREGTASMRRVLEISTVSVLTPAHPEHLKSANSPEDRDTVLAALGSGRDERVTLP